MRLPRDVTMIKVAGYLVAACGVGHTVGALVMTLPRYAGGWFDGVLWVAPNDDLVAMTDTTAAFWFSVQSFGVPLLLVGLAVLSMGRHAVTPPPFLAWALVAWTVVGTVLSGVSPLLLLLLAAALLLVSAHRERRAGASREPVGEQAGA